MLRRQSQGDEEMACPDHLYGMSTVWTGLYRWWGNVVSGKEFNDEWDEEEGLKGGSGSQDSKSVKC